MRSDRYFDRIIIGAGLYGLYSAYFCAGRGQRVLVLECDDAPFGRATYINQARVHQGYHYPRSLSTAMKSAGYFARFNEDYGFCINREFQKVYATSSEYSWTDGAQFQKFCEAADIPCEELNPDKYFKKGMCDGAFLTREYTYDAMILRDFFVEKLREMGSLVEIRFGVDLERIERAQDAYGLYVREPGRDELLEYRTGFVLNATYASTNQILDLLGYEKFGIKYELCEIILCDVNDRLREYGFTVMDGPFFSIMPFGKTGLHSLTSVTFTPHATSYDAVPQFSCQADSGGHCSGRRLGNCNDCKARPGTAFSYMANLARKYLREEYGFTYRDSLFSMKPLRTLFPYTTLFRSKINTVYDLDDILEGA